MGTSSSMSLHDQLRTATMPVIERTAQHGDSEEKALDLGAQDYLAKPVPPRSLTAGARRAQPSNMWAHNYLSDETAPEQRPSLPAPRPPLAYFLPPQWRLVSTVLIVEDGPSGGAATEAGFGGDITKLIDIPHFPKQVQRANGWAAAGRVGMRTTMEDGP